jgi:hypothetical protein
MRSIGSTARKRWADQRFGRLQKASATFLFLFLGGAAPPPDQMNDVMSQALRALNGAPQASRDDGGPGPRFVSSDFSNLSTLDLEDMRVLEDGVQRLAKARDDLYASYGLGAGLRPEFLELMQSRYSLTTDQDRACTRVALALTREAQAESGDIQVFGRALAELHSIDRDLLAMPAQNPENAVQLVASYRLLLATMQTTSDLVNDEIRRFGVPASIDEELLAGSVSGQSLIKLYDAARAHNALAMQLPVVGKQLDEFWIQARDSGLIAVTPGERLHLFREAKTAEEAEALVAGLCGVRYFDNHGQVLECLVAYATNAGWPPKVLYGDWRRVYEPPSSVFAGASAEIGAVLAKWFSEAGGESPLGEVLEGRFPEDAEFVRRVFP